MKRLLVAVLAVLSACSGVSRSEYDDLQARFDEARDMIAQSDVEQAEVLATQTAVDAYAAAARQPLDAARIAEVYADDLVLFDAARGITFRSRDAAMADLASGMAAFGIEAQEFRHTVVGAGAAAVEWEMRGTTEIGTDWSFRGVSILGVEDGLVVAETLYYDPADAPWGGG
jgi:ketosteroid isomerase-like protein